MNVITRLRSLNTENGTNGFSAERSTSRNPMKKRTAAMAAPITHGSTQPRGGPWVKTRTAAAHPSVARTAPVMSSLSRSWWVSPMRSTAITTITMPTGTLMRNARRHETTVRSPPRTSPSTDPVACMAADTAMAWLRALPMAYVVAMRANPVGAATAAPTP